MFCIAQVEPDFCSTARPDGEPVLMGTTNTFDASSPIKVIGDWSRSWLGN